MKHYHAAIPFISLFLAACAPHHFLQDSRISGTTEMHDVCNKTLESEKSYKMVQSCASFFRPMANLKVEVEERTFLLSGNESGDVLLIQLIAVDRFDSVIKNLLTLGTAGSLGDKIADTFAVIENSLKSNNINIVKIIPITGVPTGIGSIDVYGLYIELTGDGYSVLKKYSVEEFNTEKPNHAPNPTPESKLALRGIFRAASGRLNR